MTNIQDREKNLEVMLQQKSNQLQQYENVRNQLVTEIVQIQGKLELLKELEKESSIKEEKEDTEK